MHTFLKYPRSTVLLLLACLAVTWAFLACRLTGDCDNEVLKQLDRDDHAFQAILFKRDCGATTPSFFHLVVLSGNITEGYENSNSLVVSEDPKDISFQWVGKKLRIEVPDKKSVWVKGTNASASTVECIFVIVPTQ